MPTASATDSVPGRSPACWCPPNSNGAKGKSRSAISAPMPNGPWNLCAATVMPDTPKARKSSGSLPATCTASVCRGRPAARQTAANSAIGCSTPVSWLPSATLTRRGGPGRSAGTVPICSSSPANCSTRTTPSEVRPNVSSRHPCSSRCSAGSITLGCSPSEMMICRGWPAPAAAVPRMARLLASVPPLVKISRSRRGAAKSAPSISAICSRAVSSTPRAAWPGRC